MEPLWSNPPLDYDQAIGVLEEWCGREVVVVTWLPRFDPLDRPYLGRLELAKSESTDDVAVFEVLTKPPDPRLTNPDGTKLAVSRDAFEGAIWVGGPPGAGLCFVQNDFHTSVFLMPEPAPSS